LEEDFKNKLLSIVTNNSDSLINSWIELFDKDEDKDIQHRYYDDFLGFFEECLETDLFIGTQEYDATVSFLIKLSDIIGHENFFSFRHCHYLAYMPLPIIKELENTKYFEAENLKKISIFFESITSKIMQDIINDKKNFEQASVAELEEREAPLSEIWDGILMVSIVGSLDSNRILKIIDKILDRLEQGDISHVVIDISAIFDMNSEVANQIMKLNHAITFMGVTSYLTGITKNIAKSLTHLDISLGDIKTYNKTKDAVHSIIKDNI
jgi:anti-anti-sigma regulatory factor